MKLIIKEYLSSLKERDELDAILPDLLSQMGLNVFISPSRGTKEYGVDVAATGSINGGEEKVYLFSVKAGNLTRSTWNSSSDQALRPSLDEILDAFIPSRIPAEHKDKPIEICLCFGGDIESRIRQEVSGYTTKNQKENLSYSEWNGDKLADYIEQYFMREELVPNHLRSQLRKSLSMIDTPEVSFKHFNNLIELLVDQRGHSSKVDLTSIRQLFISLWILYAWSREENNIESAYLASESVLLNAWEISKTTLGKTNKIARSIQKTFDAILKLHSEISNYYVEIVVLPYTDKLYALSSATYSQCPVDVNLKLFDLLGRLSIVGIWTHWLSIQVSQDNQALSEELSKNVTLYQSSLKQLITNNPMLFTPYKDDQAIDIVSAAWFLALDENNWVEIGKWFNLMADGIYFLFDTNSTYPTNIRSYAELIEHPNKKNEHYKESVTKGSILYPYISAFSAIFDFDEPYRLVQKLKSDFLEHCNFQVWYPNESTEEHYYINDANHGGTLSDVSINKEPSEFLDEIFKECEESNHFRELSALKYSFWPLIFLTCRHHRQPIPMHFLFDIYKQIQPSNKDSDFNEELSEE